MRVRVVLWDVVVDIMAQGGLVCLCRPRCHEGPSSVCGGVWGVVQGASTNELHSFPHFGIWWSIVLGHRGRSDAICWHVPSFHKLPVPLRPRPADDKQGQLVVSTRPRITHGSCLHVFIYAAQRPQPHHSIHLWWRDIWRCLHKYFQEYKKKVCNNRIYHSKSFLRL